MARVVTNNHLRPIIEAYELSESERKEFSYLDWGKIDKGEDSASFVRYKGHLYDIGEFMTTKGASSPLSDWDGYNSDSAYSAVVLRYAQPDCDYVVMGRILS